MKGYSVCLGLIEGFLWAGDLMVKEVMECCSARMKMCPGSESGLNTSCIEFTFLVYKRSHSSHLCTLLPILVQKTAQGGSCLKIQ